MNDNLPACEMCGSILECKGGFCSKCTKKLDLEEKSIFESGPVKICPSCKSIFYSSRVPYFLYPRKSPLYKKYLLYPECPSCGVCLKSKYNEKYRVSFLAVFFIAFIFAKNYSIIPSLTIFAPILVIIFVLAFKEGRKAKNDQNEYEVRKLS
jgi:hypothetical protein